MDISTRFALIMQGLRLVAAARAGRHRALAPLVILLWGRLHRLAKRFDSLVARIRAGQRPAPRAPRPVLFGPPAPRKPNRLPSGYGWMARMIPEARPFGSQLQHLLTDPDMASLLATDPRMGRLLRPLCRMLAVDPGPNGAPPPRHTVTAPDRPPPNPPVLSPFPGPSGPAVVANRFTRRPGTRPRTAITFLYQN